MKSLFAPKPPKLIALLSLILLTGCVVSKQMLVKTTVFGLQLTASPTGGAIPTMQIGLVRNEYFSNPTSTNPIYAAPFSSKVAADVNMFHQNVTEDFEAKP